MSWHSASLLDPWPGLWFFKPLVLNFDVYTSHLGILLNWRIGLTRLEWGPRVCILAHFQGY